MAKKYPIQVDVPLPIGQKTLNNREDYWKSLPYPFAEMQPGDSFLVPMKEEDEPMSIRSRVADKWIAWRKFADCPEIRFVSKLVPGGLRVWRIE